MHYILHGFWLHWRLVGVNFHCSFVVNSAVWFARNFSWAQFASLNWFLRIKMYFVCHVWIVHKIAHSNWKQPASNSPLATMGAPIHPQNPAMCLIPGPIFPAVPDCIHIWSAILPQCTGQTDIHRDQQTVGGMFDDYRPLSLNREQHGLIIPGKQGRICRCRDPLW